MLLVALPATAEARRAPQGFYGVTWDSGFNYRPDAVQDAQWDLMARSGVESVRAVFSWAAAQPRRERPASFAATDRVVARAAARRIRLLPIVFEAPRWAQLDPGRRNSPPASPAAYGAYLRALVLRYGRRGTFWREHPELPSQPVSEWQIWNEPNLPFYWNTAPGSASRWPRGYVRLLKAARRAIKGRDRKAKVVLGGLSDDSWTQLRALYRLRARRLFDVVAVHPYTKAPKDALVLVRAIRVAMRRAHDSRKPIWVTELGWPAAKGRVEVDLGLLRLTTTDGGMAKRIGSAYDAFLSTRNNKRYGVSRLYWFTWASSYLPGEGGIWEYSGLLIANRLGFFPTPGLDAYERNARRDEGCAKSQYGACLR